MSQTKIKTVRVLPQFTAGELEILVLLSNGYVNSAIAQVLGGDVETVKHHTNSMYTKLKVQAQFNHKRCRLSAARLYFAATELLTVPPPVRDFFLQPKPEGDGSWFWYPLNQCSLSNFASN